MKTLKTLLAAAFIAGTAGVAMAQSGGGAAGGDSTQQGTMKDADKNPTGANANPQAGNSGTTQGSAKTGPGTGMQTSPVSGTQKDSSTPAQAPTTDAKKK